MCIDLRKFFYRCYHILFIFFLIGLNKNKHSLITENDKTNVQVNCKKLTNLIVLQ